MKTYLKQWLSAGAVVIAILFLMASITSKVATETMKAPNFSYTPPDAKNTTTTQFTFALISPTYYNKPGSLGEPFHAFKYSLEAEIMEALTAKGYTVRGPFLSRDEMIYADKEACDLALLIDIQPDARMTSGVWQTVSGTNGSMLYRFSQGTFSLFGKVNLTAMEPLTGEKMWAKSVSIPTQTSRTFTSSKYLTEDPRTSNAPFWNQLVTLAVSGDANVSNPLTETLELSFGEIMDHIWRHLDPAEFERMIPKIKELKGM